MKLNLHNLKIFSYPLPINGRSLSEEEAVKFVPEMSRLTKFGKEVINVCKAVTGRV